MFRRLPKDAFADIPAIELEKGKTERLVIQPWVRDGYAYISLGIKDQGRSGEFVFLRRKGFALTLREAREFCLKLSAQVYVTEKRMHELLEGDEEDAITDGQSVDAE